jgi:hypothetical protein
VFCHRKSRALADGTGLHSSDVVGGNSRVQLRVADDYLRFQMELTWQRMAVVIFLALAGVLVLGGCSSSTLIRNAANTECERRVQSDRERCQRNNTSSDNALATRKDSGRDSKESWAAQTLERIEAEAGK